MKHCKAKILEKTNRETKKLYYICIPYPGTTFGEMLEWFKRHAWKACSRLKRLTSSNLVLSANSIGNDNGTACGAVVIVATISLRVPLS